MAKKRTPHKVRWSYSQLTTYERCPLAWRYRYLEQRPQLESAAGERGKAIHKELEEFLLHPRRKATPPILAPLRAAIQEARARKALPEQKVWLDRDWRRTTERKAWGVIIPDAHWLEPARPGAILHVRDLKTGKPKDFTDQLRTYLAGLINLYPQVSSGYAAPWYLRDVAPHERYAARPVILNRQQLVGIQRELTARVKRLEDDREHRPKPGVACRWCDFSFERGGPCQHG